MAEKLTEVKAGYFTLTFKREDIDKNLINATLIKKSNDKMK